MISHRYKPRGEGAADRRERSPGEVLQLAGRTDEARAAAPAARDAAASKGFVNDLRWAEARLAALDAAEPA